MPKIAQYEGNQVQTEVVQQPRAKDAPAGAFGTSIAKGLLDITQSAVDLKQRVDTTSAEEALVQFERDKNNLFFNPENGYFNTQGRNAYDNSAAATQSLEDLKIRYGETLGSQAKFMFDNAADAHITRSQTDITRHAAKGLESWNLTTSKAKIENTIENAALYYADKGRLEPQRILGRRAVADTLKLQGLFFTSDGDVSEIAIEQLETFDSSFARSAVEAATQSSSVTGEQAMEDYGDQLEGPDKVKMEGLIEKKAKVEKTQSDAREAVLTATNLVSQYDTRKDINAEVDKIEDPELRKKTRTEAIARFNQAKLAEKEQANDHYQSIIGQVNGGMSAIEIQDKDSEAWLGMTDSQRNNILSGKHMITDQILLSGLRLLPVKEKAKLDPVDFSADLKPSDLQKLTTEVEAAKRGSSGSRVKSLSSKSMQAAEGAFGKKAKWIRKSGQPTERGQKANEFLSDLQDAIDDFEDNKGSKVTPAEENDIINEFTRQIVVERSAFGFDILAADTEIDLSNAPANDVRMMNRIIDNTPNIDLTDLTDAYQFLLDNNQPVNASNLSAVYKQGRQ